MKYNDNGTIKEIKVKSFDTLPVGAIVEYSGSTIPSGWTDIGNGKIQKTSQYIEGGASLSNVYGTSNENGYTQEYINNNNGYNVTTLWTGSVTGTNQITLNNSYKNYKKLRFWLYEKHNYLEIDTELLAESNGQSVNHKTTGPVVSFMGSTNVNMAALRIYQVSDTQIVINQLPLVVINGSSVSVTANGISIVEIQGIN